MSLNHAEKLLAEKLWGKFKAVQRAFRTFDMDKSGDLSYEEFRAALRSLGVSLSDPDFKELVCKYDTNGDGTIAYDEFNAQVGPLIHPDAINTSKLHESMMAEAGAQGSALHFRADAKLGRAAIKKSMTLEERAAEAAPRLGLDVGEAMFAAQMCGRYKDLTRAFRAADADGSGELSLDEFTVMLDSLGVRMSRADVEDLAMRYDANGDGGVSCDELVARLGFLMHGSDAAKAALGLDTPLPAAAGSGASSARGSVRGSARQESKARDVEWDSLSYDDDAASIASVSTSAVDVRGVEARMRQVLGRSWVKVYKDMKKKQGAAGGVGADHFRDAMAKRGVPLTSKEIRALQRAHSSGASSARSGVAYEDIMRSTFSRTGGR